MDILKNIWIYLKAIVSGGSAPGVGWGGRGGGPWDMHSRHQRYSPNTLDKKHQEEQGMRIRNMHSHASKVGL